MMSSMLSIRSSSFIRTARPLPSRTHLSFSVSRILKVPFFTSCFLNRSPTRSPPGLLLPARYLHSTQTMHSTMYCQGLPKSKHHTAKEHLRRSSSEISFSYLAAKETQRPPHVHHSVTIIVNTHDVVLTSDVLVEKISLDHRVLSASFVSHEQTLNRNLHMLEQPLLSHLVPVLVSTRNEDDPVVQVVGVIPHHVDDIPLRLVKVVLGLIIRATNTRTVGYSAVYVLDDGSWYSRYPLNLFI